MHDGQIEITIRETRDALSVCGPGGTKAILDGASEAWRDCGELLTLTGDAPAEDGNARVALRRTARGGFAVSPMIPGVEAVVCRDGEELWAALMHCARMNNKHHALAIPSRGRSMPRGERRAEPVEIVIDDDDPAAGEPVSGYWAGLAGDIVGSMWGRNAGKLAERAVARGVTTFSERTPPHRKRRDGETTKIERHGGPAGPRKLIKPRCDPILGTVDWGTHKRAR